MSEAESFHSVIRAEISRPVWRIEAAASREASRTLSAALRVASATRSPARSTLAPTVSVEARVVVVSVVAGGTVVSAVEVRVVLLQPVRARPAIRVVNKSVFFIIQYEVAERLTALPAVGSWRIFAGFVRSA